MVTKQERFKEMLDNYDKYDKISIVKDILKILASNSLSCEESLGKENDHEHEWIRKTKPAYHAEWFDYSECAYCRKVKFDEETPQPTLLLKSVDGKTDAMKCTHKFSQVDGYCHECFYANIKARNPHPKEPERIESNPFTKSVNGKTKTYKGDPAELLDNDLYTDFSECSEVEVIVREIKNEETLSYIKVLDQIEEICHQVDENEIEDGVGIEKIMKIMADWRIEVINSHVIETPQPTLLPKSVDGKDERIEITNIVLLERTDTDKGEIYPVITYKRKLIGWIANNGIKMLCEGFTCEKSGAGWKFWKVIK